MMDQDKEKKKKKKMTWSKPFLFFFFMTRKKKTYFKDYQGCEQKKYDYERAAQKTKRVGDYQKMKIICRDLIDHLCSSAHQHGARAGVGLISDSGFLLFDWEKGYVWNANLRRKKKRERGRHLFNYREHSHVSFKQIWQMTADQSNTKKQSLFHKTLQK